MLRALFLAAGLLSSGVVAAADMQYVTVKCYGRDVESTPKTYFGTAADGDIKFGEQGLQIKLVNIDLHKSMEVEASQCRDFYWHVTYTEPVGSGGGDLRIHKPKRDWNKLSVAESQRTSFLSCANGSTVDSFVDRAAWVQAIGEALTYKGPDVWFAGVWGRETVSDPSCVH